MTDCNCQHAESDTQGKGTMFHVLTLPDMTYGRYREQYREDSWSDFVGGIYKQTPLN